MLAIQVDIPKRRRNAVSCLNIQIKILARNPSKHAQPIATVSNNA